MVTTKHTYILLAAMLLGTSSLSGCVAEYPDEWGGEDAYWQGAYANEPYYSGGYGYDTYQPAYLFGVETYHHYNGRRFEDINDAELRSGWESSHGHGSRLDWEHARPAARAAYAHVAQHNGGGHGGGHNEGGHGDHHG